VCAQTFNDARLRAAAQLVAPVAAVIAGPLGDLRVIPPRLAITKHEVGQADHHDQRHYREYPPHLDLRGLWDHFIVRRPRTQRPGTFVPQRCSEWSQALDWTSPRDPSAHRHERALLEMPPVESGEARVATRAGWSRLTD
jgi:hypothetical protein